MGETGKNRVMADNYLIVTYTEFQQIQAEAIITHYKLQNCHLLLVGNSRVSLINKKIFSSIEHIESPKYSSYKRLTLSHYHKLKNQIQDLYHGLRFQALIGAPDDNVDFAIIKKIIDYEEYWNIEDGMANYAYPERHFAIRGFIKKIIFNYLYFAKLDLHAHIGNGMSQKAFRMNVNLTTNKIKGLKIDSSPLILEYLDGSKEYWLSLFNSDLIDFHRNKSQVLVVHKDIDEKYDLEGGKILVKPHPKHGSSIKNNHFITIPVPIEVLPKVFPNIRTFIYQEYLCTSMLNLLSLYKHINIVVDFNVIDLYQQNKSAITYYKNLVTHFSKRVITKK